MIEVGKYCVFRRTLGDRHNPVRCGQCELLENFALRFKAVAAQALEPQKSSLSNIEQFTVERCQQVLLSLEVKA